MSAVCRQKVCASAVKQVFFSASFAACGAPGLDRIGAEIHLHHCQTYRHVQAAEQGQKTKAGDKSLSVGDSFDGRATRCVSQIVCQLSSKTPIRYVIAADAHL